MDAIWLLAVLVFGLSALIVTWQIGEVIVGYLLRITAEPTYILIIGVERLAGIAGTTPEFLRYQRPKDANRRFVMDMLATVCSFMGLTGVLYAKHRLLYPEDPPFANLDYFPFILSTFLVCLLFVYSFSAQGEKSNVPPFEKLEGLALFGLLLKFLTKLFGIR